MEVLVKSCHERVFGASPKNGGLRGGGGHSQPPVQWDERKT